MPEREWGKGVTANSTCLGIYQVTNVLGVFLNAFWCVCPKDIACEGLLLKMNRTSLPVFQIKNSGVDNVFSDRHLGKITSYQNFS